MLLIILLWTNFRDISIKTRYAHPRKLISNGRLQNGGHLFRLDVLTRSYPTIRSPPRWREFSIHSLCTLHLILHTDEFKDGKDPCDDFSEGSENPECYGQFRTIRNPGDGVSDVFRSTFTFVAVDSRSNQQTQTCGKDGTLEA